MAFPTTSAPTLSNWQAQFNGLTIGASTPYDITLLEGLDLPAIRSGDITRPREHGEWIGLDLMSGRDVTITGDFVTNGTSLQNAAQALGTAFVPGALTEQPLWIQIANLPALALMCRTRKRTVPIDLGYSVNAMGTMVIQVHATDPRLYASPQTASCNTGSALAGGIFPVTFPYSFSSGSVAGELVANNAGNYDTRPLLKLTGPLTDPVVFNSTTGWQLQIINPFETGFTIQNGDTLVIDTDTHAVNYFVAGLGAGSSERAWVVAGSTWPNTPTGVAGLAPGNNVIQLTSTGSTDTGSLSVQWASAYLI